MLRIVPPSVGCHTGSPTLVVITMGSWPQSRVGSRPQGGDDVPGWGRDPIATGRDSGDSCRSNYRSEREVQNDMEGYDYVIVGAGGAGAVLATGSARTPAHPCCSSSAAAADATLCSTSRRGSS